jgi:hypothetical protein
MRNRIAFFAAPLLLCAACSKAPPPTRATDVGPWSSASARIDIARFGVNTPRADGRACWTTRFSVDVREKTMHIETCIDDDPITRDVTLTDEDARTIGFALSAMREAPRTSACNASSTYLVQIYDEPRTLSHFIDGASACYSGDMRTIDRGTLEAVFATLGSIDPAARS